MSGSLSCDRILIRFSFGFGDLVLNVPLFNTKFIIVLNESLTTGERLDLEDLGRFFHGFGQSFGVDALV